MSSKPIAFDYSSLPDKDRQIVQEHTAAITQHLRKTSVTMIDIGRRLIEVRRILGKNFLRWVEFDFDWSVNTAREYIQAAECFGHLDCLEQFRSFALVMLSRRTVPQAAVQEAINRARNGEIITHTVAKKIKTKHLNAEADGQTMDAQTLLDQREIEATPPKMKRVSLLIGSVKAALDGIDELTAAMPDRDRSELANDLRGIAAQIRQAA